MTIEERLENMERELERMKRRTGWLQGAILLLVGGLVAAGVFKTTVTLARAQAGGAAEEIRANSIVLEDQKGKLRAKLGVTEYGPALMLWDENNKVRLGLVAFKDGPRLNLSDENGKIRFVGGKTETGTPEGKTISYPESSLILFGSDGKVIWSAIKNLS